MKLLPLFLSLLLIQTVVAQETTTPGFLSSDEANYDGSHLILQGHVFITHELGTMQAQKALIDKQEESKTEPFSFISLERDVLLSLLPSSEVHCDKANLNFKTCKALLASTSERPVTYTDLLANNKNTPPVSVRLTSRALELDFRQESVTPPKYEPSSLLAQDNVIFSYGSDIHLSAHKVLYHKQLPPLSTANPLQGTLVAYSKDNERSCVLHYHDQDMVSEKISIDFTHSQLHLDSPQGKLPTCLSFTPSPIAFKADALDWDEAKNTISLFGNIHLEEPSFGTLQTQEKMDVLLDRQETWWIKELKTTGPSLLTYRDETNGSHEVAASGPILIDGEKKCALIDSTAENPLCYKSEGFLVFAKSAKIEYRERDGKCLPSLLVLDGDIKLVSRDPQSPEKVGLADGLTYNFSDQSCLLTSAPGKQVLFAEGKEGMHLSAPKIQILYNSQTKEPKIKGIGAVQFTFTPDEESKIQHFLTELK